MSNLSNYLENKLIDHLLRATAYAVPTAIYVGLFTSPSSDAGPGTEPVGGGYARIQVGPSLSAWTATQGGVAGASTGTTGQSQNAADITFPAPTGNWGTITHFALFDAVTAGNMLMQTALAVPKVVNSGDQAPKFPALGLSVTLD
jgi:hypothetical protein